MPELSNFLIPLKELVRELKGSGDISVLSTPFGLDIHIKRDSGMATLVQRELLANFAMQHQVVRLLYNKEPIIQNMQLPFFPDSFLQPSEAGEKILVQLVCEASRNTKRAIDLFCGSGTFTRPLYEKGIQITGYDIASDSLNVLGVLGKERDLFRNPLLSAEFKGIDTVVIDPPRAGALQQCSQLAQSDVSTIIMISCNPVSAARDICMLLDKGNYELHTIVPIDQFIYTNHIEIFCLLLKK